MRGVYFSSVNAKTGRRKNTIKKLQTIEKMACSSAFGTPGWARTSGLSLRRRPLYPTELRGLMQEIFNYPAQQDSNELPLRRRSRYPLRYWGRYEIYERYREGTEPLLFCKRTPKGAKQGAKNFSAQERSRKYAVFLTFSALPEGIGADRARP